MEDGVDQVRQVGEMLVSKIQMMVVPLINFLAVSCHSILSMGLDHSKLASYLLAKH